MSFPRYPTYKDSGVEWLGQVPEHWEVKRLKQACHVFPSNVDKKSHDAETPVLLCNYTDVYYNETINAGMEFMAATASTDQIAKFTLRAGDTIITKDSETADDIAIAAHVPVDLPGVICGYHLSMVRPLPETDGAFIKRVFDSIYAKSCFAVLANGLTRVGLGQYALDNVELAFPPLAEQTQIAAFLDHETAKIDGLVAEQRRLMDLLKEKRQAVISHAVTQGLNPHAPMKPSGIEWLGDVPEHWCVVPLKRVLEVKDGTHATPQYVDPAEDTFPLVTSKDFNETVICFDEAKHISAEDHFEVVKRSNTERGDVLMSMIGGNIGKALIVEAERVFSIKNVALFKTSRSECLAKYMLYYLQSGLLDIQIDLLSRGGAQGFLGLGDIRNLVFFKMPPAEMQLLVQNLESRLTPFSELIKSAEESLLLMQERRTALISAAVTGQIDVREFA